jgi:hypothetical protein
MRASAERGYTTSLSVDTWHRVVDTYSRSKKSSDRTSLKVEMTPERGQAVGSWGGSANIDAGNQVMFREVPPGRYTIQGRP